MAIPIVITRTDVPTAGYRGIYAETTQAAREGCTAPGCATQETEWLDPRLGRRCVEHAPDLRDETEENECPA